ncbi:ABC transporter permease [Nonomuraea sp. NPDC050451]|uniref:ABC transporter permease n=1 Tax=Nonomuraea sp. NPDC050451 TaxID=3364364 RepID=UPI00378F7DBE
MTAWTAPYRARVAAWTAPLGSAGVAALAVVVWQVVSGMTFVVPAPAATVQALVRDLADTSFQHDLAVTCVAAFWAFVIGAMTGAVLGLALGSSRRARLVFEPLVVALNGVPKIVLYPLLLPLLHLGMGSKIALGVLFAMFPVLINVATGVRAIPSVYWSLAKSLNAGRAQTLLHVTLPAIRRPVLTGLRLAVSLALVGVVLAEFFATKRGLGRVVLQSYTAGDYPDMMATILLLVLVSFVLSLALWRLERSIR